MEAWPEVPARREPWQALADLERGKLAEVSEVLLQDSRGAASRQHASEPAAQDEAASEVSGAASVVSSGAAEMAEHALQAPPAVPVAAVETAGGASPVAAEPAEKVVGPAPPAAGPSRE